MQNFFRKLSQHARALFPSEGYYFDRPLLLLQSDDWGRVGVPDTETLESLRSSGLSLGENVYDLYGLERAEDLSALQSVLAGHKDATGRQPCLGMNFVVHNLNFAPMEADGFAKIHLLPLSDGLPRGWDRPGLLHAYREGIANGLFRPALHGSTHFCREAVEAMLPTSTAAAQLLRRFWSANTPYIYWRMPWIGYEYWNPNLAQGMFLPRDKQREIIGASVGAFAKLFSTLPRSACAPGYRADTNTYSVWSQFGVLVSQNGPGSGLPPHLGENEILHLYRNIDFEPAVDGSFSVSNCIARANECFQRGVPAIVSTHSINFHSSLKDFRSTTLKALDTFLAALTAQHSDLLFLGDEDIHALVQHGAYETAQGKTQVNVTKRKFSRTGTPKHNESEGDPS